MTFEYLADPSRGPQRKGLLPGRPEPYFHEPFHAFEQYCSINAYLPGSR